MAKITLPTKSFYFKSHKVTNHEMFKRIVQFDNWIGGLLGADIFSNGYSIHNFKFWLDISNFVFFVLLNCYDLFLFRQEAARVFFILVSLFAAGQESIKLSTYIFYLENILDHVARAEKYITNYNTKAANEIFEKWLMIICHSFFLAIVLFAFVSFAISIYPIIFYFIFGEKVLHFGFELPFIDWRTSNIAYFINFAWCCYLVALYCIAGVSAVFLSTFPIILSFGQFELINSFLEDLDNIVKSQGKDSSNDVEVKQQIKKIVEMHNELLE